MDASEQALFANHHETVIDKNQEKGYPKQGLPYQGLTQEPGTHP